MSEQVENMDLINQAKLAKEMDKEAISTKCLSVPLIVRKVMEHLANAHLYQASNVNKLWNFEARSVMRDRGSFIARLKSGHPCQDLLALVSQMRLMNVVPFAGISMDLNSSHFDVCTLSSTPRLDSTHYETLDTLPWKHLAANLCGHWPLDIHCPAFHLVVKVLQKFCGSLQELSFHIEPFSAHILEKAVHDCKFPQLKTLRYEAESGSEVFSYTHGSFIYAVVSRAERNHVELHMKNYVTHLDRALKGGNVELLADYEFNPVCHYFSESTLAALRLKKCTLSPHRYGVYLPFSDFNRIVPVLLKSSSTSLVSLHMDLIHALPLMCYGISLENLAYLRIDAGFPNVELAQPAIMLTLFKALDFTRVFPKLSRARVFLSISNIPQGDFRQFVAQADAQPRGPAAPHRAANIKHLSFSATTTPEDAPFPLFAQMFPNIQKLSFETYEKREAVFRRIWKHWTALEELEVRASFGKFNWSKKGDPIPTWTANLDSEFCGIFPQEVTELRKKDEEYLKAVNIVPVRPAITCMKALRTFRMLCKENVGNYGDNDPNFVFSKVTCLIAFARCPNLSVVLETKSIEFGKALSHMKPYTSVVIDDVMGKYDLHY